MRRFASLLLAGFSIATALAQRSGPNTNVLPGYPISKTQTDPLRGDGYLQRQVEPSIAASTYNPDHVLAAFIDYRTVDMAADTGMPINAGEAWLGMSRSFNRGRTWFGSMVPGFPGDTSATGKASPLYGLSAGGDPALAPGIGGWFFLGGVFFDRGGISNVVAIRYRDVPDKDGADSIRYQGVSIVDRGSASSQGNFDDKPALATDIARGTKDPSVCGPVYMAYSTFLGGDRASGFRTKLAFARSKQGKCGSAWDKPVYINKNYAQNQGAAIAVDPRNGKIYVVWRVFGAPDGSAPDLLLVATSMDGVVFTDPIVIASGLASFRPYDQRPTTTESTGSEPTFRTNAFPVIAVDGSGGVYVAIQESVGPDLGPRIKIRSSYDGGQHWTAGEPIETSGPNAYQVMPSLTFGGGLLRAMWYDFRASAQPTDAAGEHVDVTGMDAALSGAPLQITGYDRQMNVRLAQAGPGVGGTDRNSWQNPSFQSSIQLSQYLIDISTAKIPKVKGTEAAALNRPNLTMYKGGYAAFGGDYISLAPAVRFVRDDTGSNAWRWAYKDTDYTAKSSFAAWYDTRDVVFPGGAIDGNWSTYVPAGTGKACANAGSRDANVYFAEVHPGIVVGSPLPARQLTDSSGNPMQRTFPFYIENQTSADRFFRVSLTSSSDLDVSFMAAESKTLYSVEILPFSTTTGTIYAKCKGASCSSPFVPFTLEVKEAMGPLDPPNATDHGLLQTGLTGAFAFNADASQTATSVDVEKHNAQVTNPQYSNPQYSNPQYSNPQYSNPQYSNPQYSNPQYSNPQYSNPQYSNYAPVGDFTWTVTNVGNVETAYTSLTNVAVPPQGSQYKYQIIISRTYYTPGFDKDCNPVQKAQDQIISIIPNPQYSNPQYSNPQYSNPQYSNPQYSNPQYSNATFYATPVQSGGSGQAAGMAMRAAQSGPVGNDDTIRMQRGPDEVKVTLRVYEPWPTGQSAPLPLGDGCTTTPLETNCPRIVAFLEQVTQVVYPEPANTGDPDGIPDPALSITTASLPNAVAHAPYSALLEAIGGSGTITWSFSGLPAGLTSTGAQIAGSAETPGAYTVWVTAVSGAQTTRHPFALVVEGRATQLAMGLVPQAIVGGSADATATLTVVDAAAGVGPLLAGTVYLWNTAPIPRVLLGQCVVAPAPSPASCTATIGAAAPPSTWTMPIAAEFVPATGSVYGSSTTSGSLVVATQLQIPATYPDGAFVGTPYTAALPVSGGAPPFSWSVSAGTLPTGLALALGAISGTPTTVGSYTFSVAVGDAAGQLVTRSYTIAAYPALAPDAEVSFRFAVPPNAISNPLVNDPLCPLQVLVQNASHSPISGATVAIGLLSNPSGGSVVGTTTATTDANGVATFYNARINAVGTGYRIAASVPGGYSAASNPFDVVAFTLNTLQRREHTATTLSDGRVLIAGGVANGMCATSTTELYTAGGPAGFTVAEGPRMSVARHWHTATRLQDDKVLVAAGTESSWYVYFGLSSAELFNPVTNSFSSTADLGQVRMAAASVLLPWSGDVLVTGGIGSIADFLYAPGPGTFSPIALGSAAWFPQAAIVIDIPGQRVLEISSNGGAAVFNAAASTWTHVATNAARTSQAVVRLVDGKVLVTGGNTNNIIGSGTDVLKSSEIFDPSTNVFAVGADMTTKRQGHTATLLPSGKVLLLGGSDGVAALTSAEVYDPATGLFAPVSTGLAFARIMHAATLLPNGNILITGGQNTGAPFAEVYAVPAELVSPLSITTTTLPTGIAYVPYAPTGLQATGGTGSYTWTVSGLPSGMTATGAQIAGTPTATGNYTVSVSVSDSGGHTNASTYTLAVNPRTTTISIAPAPPAVPAGQSSSVTMAVTDVSPGTNQVPFGTATLREVAGMLFRDVGSCTLTSSGPSSSSCTVAVGTSTPQTFYLEARYTPPTGGLHASANGTGSFLVAPVLTLPPARPDAVFVNSPYSTTLPSTGGVAPITWALTAGPLPTGVTLAPTGVVSGTASAPGAYPFTATATDAIGQTASLLYSLQVWPQLAPAGQVAFQLQPGTTIVDDVICPVQVLVQDVLHTPLAGMNVTIDLASWPSGATLSGPNTVMTDASGWATFTGLRIDQAAAGYRLAAVATIGGTTYSALSDPFTVTAFTPGSLIRREHTATALADGRVLVAGGALGFCGTNTTEIYSAAPGGFTVEAGPRMSDSRHWHAASLLQDGNVLIAAGTTSAFYGFAFTHSSAELYNGASFTPTTGSMNTNHRGLISLTLPWDGTVLTVGGGPDTLYSPTSQSFSDLAVSSGITFPQSATVIDPSGHRVLVGSNGTDTAIYTPPSTWTPAPTIVNRTTQAVATLADGRVLVTGGNTNNVLSGNSPNAVASAEIFDPATNVFTDAGAAMTTKRQGHTATLLPNGAVLLLGGHDGTTTLSSAEVYDPGTGLFTAVPQGLSVPRTMHRATVLPNGTILITGGRDTGVSFAEVYNPASIGIGLSITTATLPVGTAHAPYPTTTLHAVGATGPSTWDITGLPPGLTATGAQISGTPTAAGTYTVTATVTFGSQSSSPRTWTLNVYDTVLGFVVQPQNATMNTVMPTVSVRATVNGVPAPGVTVSMGIDATPPSTGLLGGTLTAVTDGAGMANFPNLSVSYYGIGYRLHAVANGSSAVSDLFTILLNGGSMTYIQQPLGVAALSPIAPAVVVEARDAGSAPVQGLNITLSIAPPLPVPGSTLSGNATRTTGVDGRAVFNDLSIDYAAPFYRLQATASNTVGVSASVSNSFTVNCSFGINRPPGNIVYAGDEVFIGLTASPGCGPSAASLTNWAVLAPAPGGVNMSVAPNHGYLTRTIALDINSHTETFTQDAASPVAPCRSTAGIGVFFDSVDNISGPNFQWDYAIVGPMSMANFTAMKAIPAPDVLNQRFCGPVPIAPGYMADAYVPTAFETAGNFSDFVSAFYSDFTLIDPMTNLPFPSGLIPSARLPNPAPWRVGSVTPCSPTLTSPGMGGSALPFPGTMSFTAPSACGWRATTSDTWIHFTGPTIGAGDGAVPFWVDANATGLLRTGHIQVGTQTFTITQGT